MPRPRHNKARGGEGGGAGPLRALVMAASIPVLMFAGWAAYRSADDQRAATLRIARDTVARVGERIGDQMTAEIQVAETLAASSTLDAPDLASFYSEAQRIVALHPLWHTLELDDPAGEQVLNLLRPLGTALGPTADRATFEAVVSDRRPAIGGIGPMGRVSGQRLVALRVPVIRDGALRQVLTLALAPDAVSAILRGSGLPEGWIGAVVDRSGHLIARSADAAETVGQPASPSVRSAIAAGQSGFYRGRTRGDVPVTTVFETLPRAGDWTVHLAIPRQVLDRPVRRALYAVGAAAAASLALALALVTSLSRDLARRRRQDQDRAAADLAASEGRAALAVEAAELGTWRWAARDGRVLASDRCRSLFDLPGGETSWSTRTVLEAVHPDDRPALRSEARRCIATKDAFAVGFRTAGLRGPSRWLEIRGRTVAGPDGGEIHGVVADIGRQKRDEAERSDLLRRLANAQEEVQRRIAHDLHDEVGQTVTGLSLGLKALERALVEGGTLVEGSTLGQGSTLAQGGGDLGERVRWLQHLTGTIGRDLHRVAGDLRPAALDDLGLPRALAAMAADWSARYGVTADIQVIGSQVIGSPVVGSQAVGSPASDSQAGGTDERLPDEVATVIYRVVQEALTNVLKHARATTVSVVLDRRPRDVRLVIEDDGAGFDPEAPASTAGGGRRRLGLLGMRERLGLIGGTLRVESSTGCGTTLFVAIPLASVPARDAA